jgi:hypothetical protein
MTVLIYKSINLKSILFGCRNRNNNNDICNIQFKFVNMKRWRCERQIERTVCFLNASDVLIFIRIWRETESRNGKCIQNKVEASKQAGKLQKPSLDE